MLTQVIQHSLVIIQSLPCISFFFLMVYLVLVITNYYTTSSGLVAESRELVPVLLLESIGMHGPLTIDN